MAAGVPAVRGAEQQPLVLCPCARLCPGFVSEAFGHSGRSKVRLGEDVMATSPLCPGDSELSPEKGQVKNWSGVLGVLGAFYYCGRHQGQKQRGED